MIQGLYSYVREFFPGCRVESNDDSPLIWLPFGDAQAHFELKQPQDFILTVPTARLDLARPMMVLLKKNSKIDFVHTFISHSNRKILIQKF